MSDFLRLVGERLRMVRKLKGLTQDQLAEKTGKDSMSKSHISDIERGQRNISLLTLEILMNALEIDPSELFNFQKLDGEGIHEKKLILDIHKSMLMERGLDEVKYVVRTTNDFLDTIDAKESSRKNRKS
ncbi:helix-turn-helix transcriptional regulator [Paenibacillus frigoriresistens]|uniref:helix-turn-helix domain-containing protein n=1 Tax=Paenibacillus alginolyticus TaxID=59839 RepID=UPI001567149D|nr:helix-turn-helix transcriptional regulator [Paenibacillus frigoriresistens]NRF96149.1 helix-turn-helix transcriptional regulator [Paenibacillus frigoriresistens]